ncbi:MAG: hypothetical protein Q9224_005799, partial [Gallowayella concinna]
GAQSNRFNDEANLDKEYVNECRLKERRVEAPSAMEARRVLAFSSSSSSGRFSLSGPQPDAFSSEYSLGVATDMARDCKPATEVAGFAIASRYWEETRGGENVGGEYSAESKAHPYTCDMEVQGKAERKAAQNHASELIVLVVACSEA